MVQINFGSELLGDVDNQGGGTSQQPLQNWYVSPVTIDGDRYFLHIEKDSGLPVITKQLESFLQVYQGIMDDSGFLAKKQRAKVMAKVGNVRYRFQPTAPHPLMATYQQAIEDMQEAMVDALDLHPRWPDVDVSRNLSLELVALLKGALDLPVMRQFAGIVNALYPLKLIKPRVRSKNCTVTPAFRDPREWEDLHGQPVAEHPREVHAIRANNEQMIAQFLEVAGDEFGSPEGPGDVLNDFLNRFLLTERIQVFTANVAVANDYSWQSLRKYEDDHVGQVLGAFFEFLGRAGIVQWTTAQDVGADLETTAAIFAGENDRANYELERMADEIPEFRKDPVAYLKKATDLINTPEQEERLRETLKYFAHPRGTEDLDPDNFPANPENLEKTYVISAYLKDYQPRVSRKFRVSGGTSMMILQMALITMFSGDGGHMFDLENPKTGEMYMLPEFNDDPYMQEEFTIIEADVATVSLLNVGDKLTFHYDYGDGWEFQLTVKKILDEPGDRVPVVTMAHGYGIIDDIGGVGALADYRRDFKRGRVPEEIREWLGGELIDPDQADELADINAGLRFVLQDDL